MWLTTKSTPEDSVFRGFCIGSPMKLRMLKSVGVPVLNQQPLKVLEAKAGTTQRVRGRKWMRARDRVLLAGAWACASCGRTHPSNQVDHVVSLEQGGANDDVNLQVLCVDCHSAKTAAENRRRHSGC